MYINKRENLLFKREDFSNIVILTSIAISIGIYLIARTTLIAKDGVCYINYAKMLAVEPLSIIRDCSAYAPVAYTPGYPFLILLTHKLIDLFLDGTTISSWIYSAQGVNLFCMVLSFIPLYFIGKEFVGARFSFWSLLILVFLPYPAKMGSDVLRDWPNILFLTTGFWCLLRAAKYHKTGIFCIIGLIAGLGYIIRPICAQLIIYGFLWLLRCLFTTKKKLFSSRNQILAALALLIIGFAAIAIPYMILKGEIIPLRVRQILNFSSNQQKDNTGYLQYNEDMLNSHYKTAWTLPKTNTLESLYSILNSFSQNLMYYFTPFCFVGLYYQFRKKTKKGDSTFFLSLFLLFNLTILFLRYSNPISALSKRYLLPLTVIIIFFIPCGFQVIAQWIQQAFPGKKYHNAALHNQQRWFFILLIIGLVICIPKLLKPIRIEKTGYKTAAQWLKQNTSREDVIDAPDIRINFYAERKLKERRKKIFSQKINYIVRLEEENQKTPEKYIRVWSSYLNEKDKKEKVVIYKHL
jgi:hypothetical protein